jgi:hypothetical protein
MNIAQAPGLRVLSSEEQVTMDIHLFIYKLKRETKEGA